MSRLTVKNPNGKQLILNDGRVINHFSSLTESWMICDKLGKLEDLEEELGCPLEVVFKAVKIGIITKDGAYFRLPDFGIYNEKFALYLVGANNSMLAYKNTFYTKDYKKTWWLKGDKK